MAYESYRGEIIKEMQENQLKLKKLMEKKDIYKEGRKKKEKK